jgi:predicted nucleic acid-binding protein
LSVLADTSVWVDYFHGRPASGGLDSLLERNDVLVCGPVVAELLAGTAPDQVDVLWLAVGSLPSAPVDDAVWREAGERAGALRRRAASVPLLDVVIGVAAANAGAELWTHDRDFDRVCEVVPQLRLHEPLH